MSNMKKFLETLESRSLLHGLGGGALAEGAMIEAEGTDVADSITVGLSDDGSLVQVTSDDGTVLAEGDVDEVKSSS